jgi:hypothetical protein
MSTVEYQDEGSSRRWQYDSAADVVAGHGRTRRYVFTGLVVCGICGRRADGHWVHGRAGYRCRHGRTSASPPLAGCRKALYMREDKLAASVADQVGGGVELVGDPVEPARGLSANRLMIVCDLGSVRITGQQRPPLEPPVDGSRGG